MKGKVKCYVASKKYGFIDGEDGESYFLHKSDLDDLSAESSLLKNVVVEFDPMPSPKGLIAKKIVIPKVYLKKIEVDFFTSKGAKPKNGIIEREHSIQTRYFRDLNQARSHIEKLAIESKCNAILNLAYEKTTFSSGNYRYNMHAFKGDFALVTENIPCDSQEKVFNSFDDLKYKIQNFDSMFNEINSLEREARQEQLKGPSRSNSTSGFSFFGVVAMWIIIIIFSNIGD